MAIAQDPFSILLWNIGYAFCHQLPERSLFYSGFQMPVCARDMGTYLGFLVVFFFWLAMKRYRSGTRPDKMILVLAAIGMLPYFLDAVASYLGIYTTNNVTRLFTGLFMGASMGLVLLAAFQLIVVKQKTERRTFVWSDLIPIYAIILTVGIFAISFDLGAPMFYVLETLTISGILALLFIAMLTALHFVLRGSRFQAARSGLLLPLAAAVIEVGLIAALWLLHDAVAAFMV